MPNKDTDLKEKRICKGCVGEPFLQALVAKNRQQGDCDYCGKTDWTMTICDMANLVDAAFRQHFTRTATEPDSMEYRMMNDSESSYTWYREGSPIGEAIAWEAQIPEEAASDVAEILSDEYGDFESSQIGEETEYDGDSHYDRKAIGSGDWQEEWRSFESALRTESRFFNQSATAYLSSLFEDLHKLSQRDGAPVVVEVGPGRPTTILHRGRVFQNESDLISALANVDRELAPPPPLRALAGRMNARGISVFYGATDPAVALAEIRPPVGSRVAISQFEIVRPLRLLDVRALRNIVVEGSIFDPSYASLLEKTVFLQTLEERITRPVMPDDESLDYLITQAVADYLATSKEMPLDGLIYRSAQAPSEGANVVLFHKASRVEALERPEGTEVEASGGMHDEEGWQTEYRVIERVPPTAQPARPDPLEGLKLPRNWDSAENEYDERDVTLRIDLNAVKVELVKSVKFETQSHHVLFWRWEKKDREF